MDTSKLKLKVSVTYSWEEEIDPREYENEDISNIKEHYILTGDYQECISDFDTHAINCLPDGYKCSIDLKWEN